MIGMMLEDFLDELGHDCHGVAAEVDQACDIARAGGFDAAILDCNLNGHKVWPVATILTERNIPFLFATGGMGEDMPEEFVALPRLAKPFTLEAVEVALSDLLRG